ncbi:anaphase-promoting complex subunit 4 [Anopheles bellator]|uniref:anaphase-promoting complex subunit 4 n=1 Tax=Anopheles bellator TaxID=139047 RepID=UPI002648FC68|nr:anaphase-promoting complex subunit 4 [Anopheles bellator]
MAGQYSTNRNLMKQTSNKNIGCKVDVLQWSEEMDLLAIGTEKGDVILQRLKWQKVWQLSPPEDGLKVRGIAWRPLEKMIAIGYSNGAIVLINIENKEEVHSFSVESDISFMNWTENREGLAPFNGSRSMLNNHLKYLPELPALSSLSSSAKPTNHTRMDFCAKHILQMLLVGTTSGLLHLSALGMLPAGRVDVFATAGLPSTSKARICDAKLSANFKQLVVALVQDAALNVIVLENNVLHKYSGSLLNLAIKHAQILNTMTYINETIECIIEAWETVLLEMDNKLTHYAKDQPEGSISADFLELLMFGITSPALEKFLLRDLTEKGLRKLGYSIELSYVMIQKLVVKPLYSAAYAVFYHLTVLEGMLRNRYYYGPLMSSSATEALRDCGAFQIKAYELQQTIDTSKRDFKIFFRWLNVVIVRLMDEPLQENQPTITQQEINYLADFLSNFDGTLCHESGATNESRRSINARRKFNLERVGQYLEDKPLVHPTLQEEPNQWKRLLEQNECFRDCPVVFAHREELSLLQEHKRLKASLGQLFDQPSGVIATDFRQKNLLTIRTAPNDAIRSFSFTNHTRDDITLIAIVQSSQTLLFGECHADGGLKIVRLRFEEKPYFDQRFDTIGTITFRHAQFYNEDTLSLLLRTQADGAEERCTASGSYFLQLNLHTVRQFLRTVETHEFLHTLVEDAAGCHVLNMYTLIDESALKMLDGTDGFRIAVSGKRNMAAVLAESLRNVRIYDMDGQEEEDDLLDTSSQINSSLENSQESIQA